MTEDKLLLVLARHEVRKLGFRIEGHVTQEWKPELVAAIRDLMPYVEMREDSLAYDILSILSGVALHTRQGMPPTVADMIANVATCALPIRSLLAPAKNAITKIEMRALILGAQLGGNIAYDAALYLRNFVVFDAGVSILWDLHRYAHLNSSAELLAVVEEEYRSAADGARRNRFGEFTDALRWLEFKRLDALGVDDPPEMPNDLAAKIFDREEDVALIDDAAR